MVRRRPNTRRPRAPQRCWEDSISNLELLSESEPVPHSTLGMLIGCLKKYFDSTSLHGFKYLSEPNRPLYERIYWLIAIVLVYTTVALITIDQIKMFLKSPILITFDSKSRSVDEIPFPAVTVCSDSQIRSSMINLTEAFENVDILSSEMRKKFEYAVYICDFNYPADSYETFDSDFVHDMLEDIFGNGTCTRQIPEMEWLAQPVPTPCLYFQPMVSVKGACLSFNMLPFTHIFRNPAKVKWDDANWTTTSNMWSPDTGFAPGGGVFPESPPWKTIGNNIAYFGFNINLDQFEELCSRGGTGFSVYIHNPAEMPSLSHPMLYLEENRDTMVSVYPKLYITDQSLRQWSTSLRGCYFQNERFLKYFHIYTQHNCELECRANVTLNICDCVPLYYPRNTHTPICGPAKRVCVDSSVAKTGEAAEICDCLPSCSELQFDISVNKVPRNLSQDLLHQSNETYTILKVMFQTNFFIGIKRTVMFGFSDFVANVGGLLGLFLGFSILSLVEIIYFMFFRPATNFARRRRRVKALKVHLKNDLPKLPNKFEDRKVIGYQNSISKNIRL